MPPPAGVLTARALPRRVGEMAERRCCSSPPLPERRGAVTIYGVVGLRFAWQGIANGDGGIARDGGISWLNDGGGDSPLAARGTKRGGHGEWPKRRMVINGKNVLLEVSFLHVVIESPRMAESRDSAWRRIWPERAGKGGRGGQERAFSVGERRRAESCKSLWDKGLCAWNKKASRWSPGGFWIIGRCAQQDSNP